MIFKMIWKSLLDIALQYAVRNARKCIERRDEISVTIRHNVSQSSLVTLVTIPNDHIRKRKETLPRYPLIGRVARATRVSPNRGKSAVAIA